MLIIVAALAIMRDLLPFPCSQELSSSFGLHRHSTWALHDFDALSSVGGFGREPPVGGRLIMAQRLS